MRCWKVSTLAEVPISGPITNLQEVQTALLAGLIKSSDAIGLVGAYLDANEDLYGDGDLAELVCLNPKREDVERRAPDLLGNYLKRAHPEFDPLRAPSERMGRACLKIFLEAYIRGELQPSHIRACVTQFEHLYDYPIWLGDLFNACDWWLPKHEASGLLALRKEAQRLILTL